MVQRKDEKIKKETTALIIEVKNTCLMLIDFCVLILCALIITKSADSQKNVH